MHIRQPAPTLERSPEVYHVLKAMDVTGVDFFVDVHGDEALPFAFVRAASGEDQVLSLKYHAEKKALASLLQHPGARLLAAQTATPALAPPRARDRARDRAFCNDSRRSAHSGDHGACVGGWYTPLSAV